MKAIMNTKPEYVSYYHISLWSAVADCQERLEEAGLGDWSAQAIIWRGQEQEYIERGGQPIGSVIVHHGDEPIKIYAIPRERLSA